MRNMRNMRPMGRKAQAGFIQNFIIPGIILIGVVIAGIAMLSGGNGGTDTSNEQASMTANAVIAQSLTLSSAINRAEGDGAIPSAATVYDDATATTLSSVLVTTGYIPGTLPAPPANSQSVSGPWAYSKGAMIVTDAQAVPSNIGSAVADDVLYLDNVTEAVCRRINNKLYGTSTALAAAPVGSFAALAVANASANVADVNRQRGASEGCVAHGAAFAYYKVVNIK